MQSCHQSQCGYRDCLNLVNDMIRKNVRKGIWIPMFCRGNIVTNFCWFSNKVSSVWFNVLYQRWTLHPTNICGLQCFSSHWSYFSFFFFFFFARRNLYYFWRILLSLVGPEYCLAEWEFYNLISQGMSH